MAEQKAKPQIVGCQARLGDSPAVKEWTPLSRAEAEAMRSLPEPSSRGWTVDEGSLAAAEGPEEAIGTAEGEDMPEAAAVEETEGEMAPHSAGFDCPLYFPRTPADHRLDIVSARSGAGRQDSARAAGEVRNRRMKIAIATRYSREGTNMNRLQNKNRARPVYAGTLALLLILCASVNSLQADSDTEWTAYGADKWGTKYAPLDQINGDNFNQLEIAWRWSSVDDKVLAANPDFETAVYEATPLKIGDVLYVSTSMSQVAAINAVSGETIWEYDAKTWEEGTPVNVGFVHRGVSHWSDGDDGRILYGTGDAYLIALDADTGKPVSSFGDNGRVDLTKGLRRPIDRRLYGVSSPPTICGDVIVIGSTVLDAFALELPPKTTMPPGDVRGFDARTGEQLWVFQTIPQEGEYGNNTWEKDSFKTTGSANVWTVMSADEELGYVYLPVSTPTNDYYGAHRLGDNLFGESLVCLNAQTGERVWHFQILHHGLWDYDLPAHPNLVDIEVGGRKIKAVAQVTKQGFCFVFDRVTGEPVWPIEEKPVPASTAPGERSSPTQPFPTRPAAFDRQGLTEDDLADFTPEVRAKVKTVADQYEYGALYTPPTQKGTILVPGIIGGGSWAGAAVNPKKGVIYVPSYTIPLVVELYAVPVSDYDYVGYLPYGPDGLDDLPLTKPPYGRITAIDLNTGEHSWMQPVGDGPIDHPMLKDLELPPLGAAQRNFVLLTDEILVAANQAMWDVKDKPSKRGNAILIEFDQDQPHLRAFDPADGRLVGEIELPSNAHGAPMTYMAGGRQYIVVAIGGANEPAELVAVALPQ